MPHSPDVPKLPGSAHIPGQPNSLPFQDAEVGYVILCFATVIGLRTAGLLPLSPWTHLAILCSMILHPPRHEELAERRRVGVSGRESWASRTQTKTRPIGQTFKRHRVPVWKQREENDAEEEEEEDEDGDEDDDGDGGGDDYKDDDDEEELKRNSNQRGRQSTGSDRNTKKSRSGETKKEREERRRKEEVDTRVRIYGELGKEVLKRMGVLSDFLAYRPGQDQDWFLALHNLAYLRSRLEGLDMPACIGEYYEKVLQYFSIFKRAAAALKQDAEEAGGAGWRTKLEEHINAAYIGDDQSSAWEAFQRLVFPEIPYVGLGFAKYGKKGYGIKAETARKILRNVLDIIEKASGESGNLVFLFFNLFKVFLSTDPSPTMEERRKLGVGMDKLGDLLTCLILPSLLKYTDAVTKKICDANPDFSYCEYTLHELVKVQLSICFSSSFLFSLTEQRGGL